jgi:CheY-specific phosphatase CheX
MGIPIKADVVNAFLEPALEQLRALAGSETTLERLEIAQQLPDGLTLRVELHGGIEGPVFWSFDPSLAQRVAAQLTHQGERTPKIADAVVELANVIARIALEALRQAGYQVEFEPFEAQAGPQALGEPGLPSLIVATPSGRVRLAFGLNLTTAPKV